MKQNKFERELPDGYSEVLRIDAKSTKVGIIFNAIALIIAAVCLAAAIFLLTLKGNAALGLELFSDGAGVLFPLIFLAAFCIYIVLHELTHGAAYKLMTGEKLTYGITLTVAFCGVPNIYVYKRTSIIASAAPLIIFSLILGVLTTIFYFVSIPVYLLFSLVFAFHLGGCAGDMYIILLLLFKFKDQNTLVRDTGPMQTFYIKK